MRCPLEWVSDPWPEEIERRRSAAGGDGTPPNPTDAPHATESAHKPRDARRESLPLPAAGEENFCPKVQKLPKINDFYSDFPAQPPGWILRFLDRTKS